MIYFCQFFSASKIFVKLLFIWAGSDVFPFKMMKKEACHRVQHVKISRNWSSSFVGRLCACLKIKRSKGNENCAQPALRQDPLWDYFSHLRSWSLNFFFCLKALGKNEKWHHFYAHAQRWSPWRRKNVEKGHLAPLNLTFLLIAIETFFAEWKKKGRSTKTCLNFF